MLFKSFLGLRAEKLPPNHTIHCRFRQRLEAEGFQRLFNKVVDQAHTQVPGKSLSCTQNWQWSKGLLYYFCKIIWTRKPVGFTGITYCHVL
jgi:IS5 family transposase